MATGKSGSFTLSASYFTCQISWSETYDPITNESVVTINAKVKTSGYLVDYYPNGTIKVNGSPVVTFNSATPTDMIYFASKGTYYSFTDYKGVTSGPWVSGDIAHESNGSKNVDIAVDFNLYTPSGSYGSGARISGSKTIALTSIDRAAPTVSVATSNITISGFKISATASTSCDRWDYSLDNGETWKNFSTTKGTSASVSLTGLEVNTTYDVKVRARKVYNGVYGTSAKKATKTLGHAIVNSCPAFYADTDTVSIKPVVTVYETAFKYYVTLKNGSTVLFKTSALTFTAGKATRTITLTDDQRTTLLNAMSKVKSKSFTFVIQSYSGTSLIGETSASVTANTAASRSAPGFPGFAYSDTKLAALTGDDQVLVEDYSSLKVVAEAATAKNGASIVSYSATIGGKTVKSSSTSLVIGAVDSPGSFELSVSVIDSRGYSTTLKKTVKVLKYEKPKISRITLRRANGIDKTIQLSISGSITSLKPDGSNEVNSVKSVSFRYKNTGENTYSSDNAVSLTSKLTISSNKTSFSYETNELLNLDEKTSYDFRFYIEDGVTHEYFYFVVPRGIPLLALRKDKLGINNPTPQYTLDVAGDIGLTGCIFFEGRNVIGDTGWIDLGLSDDVSEAEDNPNLGHYYGCAYRVVGGNHVYVAFSCSAAYSGSSITVNENAIPSAYRPSMQPYAIVPLNGSRIARIFVSRSLGNVCIEWVRNVADDTEPETQSLAWIDGYLDYWI